MKITCGIAEDLLPLYMDGGCTKETAEAMEGHLSECERCRNMHARMQTELVSPQTEAADIAVLQRYSKKLRRGNRLRILLTVCVIALGIVLGTLSLLTIQMMERQSQPNVYPHGDEVWDLTVNPLVTNSEQCGGYTLFTNYTQIKVEISGTSELEGEVFLYHAGNPEPILSFRVNEEHQEGCFTGLSSQYYYIVEVESDAVTEVTISEGRRTDFFYCLGLVLDDLF